MKIRNIIKDAKNAKKTLEFKQKSVTIFGSARLSENAIYWEKAYELSNKLAKENYAIITGGGGGIMRAANKGAYDANNAPSVGLNILLPFEQKSNEYLTNSTIFSMLASRKVALVEKSNFFVIFPGGFGTLDELFEILTLVQIGYKKAKVYLYAIEFWKPLIEFFKTSLLANKTIKESDLKLFLLTNDIEEIINDIKLNN